MDKSLADHRFLRQLGQIVGEVIEETVEQKDNKLVQLREYEPHEEYITEVLRSAGEVDTILAQLAETSLFMSNFRTTPKLKEEGVGRFNHIVYHIENFLIRLTGCFDRSLILVNIALDLGNAPEDCNYWLLRKNRHVKKSGVLGPLGQINGIVKPYRDRRNMVAHRERFSDPALRELELLHLVRNSDKTDSDQIKRWDHYAKLTADQLVAKRKEDMHDTSNKLGKAVGSLFNVLKPLVHEHYENIKPAV